MSASKICTEYFSGLSAKVIVMVVIDVLVFDSVNDDGTW
jgi:hypothetical protein